jgi:bacterial leucyl aminopeptidase
MSDLHDFSSNRLRRRSRMAVRGARPEGMSPMSDVVLFDPFQTLGSEIATEEERWVDFEVYPSARAQVRELARRPGVRIGVFVLDPEVPRDRLVATLESGGLIPPIDPDLVRVVERDAVRPFANLRTAGLAEQRVVFVSLDAYWRARALDAGLRVAPHPALAEAVLEGDALHFVRVVGREDRNRVDWQPLAQELPIVPVLQTPFELYAIAAGRALERLARPPLARTFGFEQLPGSSDLVARTTLFLLHVTKAQVEGNTELRHFVETLPNTDPETGFPPRHTSHGLLVAYPGDQDIEALHPPPAFAGHGHTRELVPSLSLLKPPRVRRLSLQRRDLTDDERNVIATLDSDEFRRELEACVGSLDG